jgi:hypothetical protein
MVITYPAGTRDVLVFKVLKLAPWPTEFTVHCGPMFIADRVKRYGREAAICFHLMPT